MNDTMNEITAFSALLEDVWCWRRSKVRRNARTCRGAGIETKAGDDRSMYVYVPASGCPDAKQTQVVDVSAGWRGRSLRPGGHEGIWFGCAGGKGAFCAGLPQSAAKRLERKGRGRHGLSLPLLYGPAAGQGKGRRVHRNDLLYRRFSVSRRTAACDERAKAPECGGRAALGAPCGLQHPAGRRERAAGGLSLRRQPPAPQIILER